jgi:glycosyltransferase involved in cell wall biosynthesis
MYFVKVKTVLLSQVSLPFTEIGSWPKMYDYFLENNNGVIDYIICPNSNSSFHKGVTYLFIKEFLFSKFLGYLTGYYKQAYLDHLGSLLMIEDKMIVKIIDNTGLLFEVQKYLVRKELRDKVKIVFFMHGYSYFFDPRKTEEFYNAIDHMVYLSEASYKAELNRTHCISSKVSILPNGIDSTKFYPIQQSLKERIKNDLSIKGNIVFFWCANDRPKKGLHILLDAWRKSSLYKDTNYELLIIGVHEGLNDDNINFIGRIENDKLPRYYQISDFYLFTTLCHEGFPLSLTEALACGLKCLVSDIDPLLDIFSKFGNVSFVKNPNVVSSWTNVLENAKASDIDFQPINRELIHKELSLVTWSSRLKQIVDSESESFKA